VPPAFEAAGCAATAAAQGVDGPHGKGGVTEDNVLVYLGTLEQRLAELLEVIYRSFAESLKPLLNPMP